MPSPLSPHPLFFSLALAASLVLLAPPRIHAGAPPHQPRMSWLDNGVIRLGVDLEVGGAITWLSLSGDHPNVINSFDWGRQVQMSFYSGPVPFSPDGKKPAPEWAGLGWNPIQAGDYAGHRAEVLSSSNDGKVIHLTCRPMQWPLSEVPGDCTFESWLSLDGAAVCARARLLNARLDRTAYPARDQELPAVYTNGAWYRLFSYTGAAPFTGAPIEELPAHPAPQWGRWIATENWSALLDAHGWGLGVWHPGTTLFGGGFNGKPGAGGPADDPCGYLSPTREEILDPEIDYSFQYELILGTAEEIRARALSHPRPESRWSFAHDRAGWSYRNATDSGWPIRDGLHLEWKGADPQLVSPPFFCPFSRAATLHLTAAFTTADIQAALFWAVDDSGFSEQRKLLFPIQGDGQLRTYEIPLKDSFHGPGGLVQLRLDPATSGPGSLLLQAISLSP